MTISHPMYDEMICLSFKFEKVNFSFVLNLLTNSYKFFYKIIENKKKILQTKKHFSTKILLSNLFIQI